MIIPNLRIVEESANDPTTLLHYGSIPIAFMVTSWYSVHAVDRGLGGLILTEESVNEPYIKDYDAYAGEGPTRWATSFDISYWGLLGAFAGNTRIGGAVIAWNTPGVDMLDGRDDLAVLWDLRVHPNFRGRGVGGRLFATGETWARSRGAKELKVEAQNINVPACRFYAAHGCELRTIRHGAYVDFPEEVQLLWHKNL